MTASTVKSGLDEISTLISEQRFVLQKIIAMAQGASDALAAIPTDYSAVLAEIDAYGTSDAFESLSKAEKAKMTAEFTTLKATLDQIATTTL